MRRRVRWIGVAFVGAVIAGAAAAQERPEPAEPAEAALVRVSAAGEVKLDGAPVAAPALADGLRARTPPAADVRIAPEPGTRWEHVAAAALAAERAGAARRSLEARGGWVELPPFEANPRDPRAIRVEISPVVGETPGTEAHALACVRLAEAARKRADRAIEPGPVVVEARPEVAFEHVAAVLQAFRARKIERAALARPGAAAAGRGG